MTKDELLRATEINAELRAKADTDEIRVDEVIARIDRQLEQNHFAQIFYETMRRREPKAR